MSDVITLFAGVPVRDYAAAVPWYERLFGRAADYLVSDHEVMWRFDDAAWLYVVGDPKRAGSALVTLRVSDLDETVAELQTRGVEPGAIAHVGDGGARKSPVVDAEGNMITFIEVPGQ